MSKLTQKIFFGLVPLNCLVILHTSALRAYGSGLQVTVVASVQQSLE